MDCRETQHLLETFVDGELRRERTLSVEAHLDQCAECAEHQRFLEALRASARQAVYAGAAVSTGFDQRLRAALLAEREREDRTESFLPQAPLVPAALETLERGRPWSLSWKGVLPLGVAAAVLLWLRHTGERVDPVQANTAASVSEAAIGIDQALDRLIDYHSAPPPAQVTSQDLLPTFDRDVGVRVHAPVLDKFGASWEGASLVPVVNHQAASLRYRMPGRRFTVYVYDPRRVSVHQSLTRRLVHDHAVYVGEWRGYTVAAKENQGIGYAMASDMDDVTTAQVLTEIH